MDYKSKHTQQKQMPIIDLTKLKDYTELDWKNIVNTVPFTNDPFHSFRDYTDGSNVRCTNFVFTPRVCKTATESGMSMLRTLNFMCGGQKSLNF
jgi:hypothetical protein